MNSTLKLISIDSVSSTYRWDDGVPQQSLNRPALYSLSSYNATENTIEYVGYAPFVSVLLSSTNEPALSSHHVRRTVDFGDYYNSSTSSQSVNVSGETYFTHTYIMPGVYKISLSEKEYVMKFNPLKLPAASYYQNTYSASNQASPPFQDWRWESYKCGSAESYKYSLTWDSKKFQKHLTYNVLDQLIDWKNSSGRLRPLDSQIYWQWDNLFCAPDVTNIHAKPVLWQQTRNGGRYSRAWNQSLSGCTVDDFVLFEEAQIETNLGAPAYNIRVLENTPVAYLSAQQPELTEDRLSPLTVRLTPRYTQAGSFPIEKIVWDLGDGSPLITRRRWEKNVESPFVYSGVLSADYKDPRNFDIIHTYRKTKDSVSSFYPSITAYSSSTNSSDSAATTVGPINASEFAIDSFVLTQTKTSSGCSIYIGEINKTLSIWKTNN